MRAMASRCISSVLRMGALAMLAASGTVLLLSSVRPISFASGELALLLARGSVGVVVADQQIGVGFRDDIALIQIGKEGRLALAGPRHWKWSREIARISVGPAAGPVTTSTIRLWWVPLWMIVGPAAIASGVLVWRARRVPKAGHCVACGYDIARIACPRCPECGIELPAAPAIAGHVS